MREPSKLTGDKLEDALNRIFGDFRTYDEPELAKALDQAKKFCRDMASADRPARWITFLGPSGVGKTMLVKRIKFFFARYLDCLPDERNSAGEVWTRRGGFKPWIDVVNDMLTGDYSGIRDLSEDWFVALDDVGVEYERNRELAISKLFQILNRRQGLFTALTANLTLEEISARMDTRIASRLLRDNASLVIVDAQDFNLRD